MAINTVDKIFLTKNLATLLKAGIPIVEAVDTVALQTQSPTLRDNLNNIKNSLSDGKSLSSSLRACPGQFDNYFICMVESGEKSGTLESNLEFLADQINKSYLTNKKIQSALTYPSFIVVAALIMGTFVSIFILPRLVDFFAAFGTDLPLPTKILLAVSTFMKNYGLVFFGSFFSVIVAFVGLYQLKPIRTIFHRLFLKLPIIGPLTVYGESSRFCRNLSTLTNSGLGLYESLTITASTLTNLKFQQDTLIIAKRIEEGITVHQALDDGHFSEFSQMVKKMVAIGEKTGNLSEMLAYLAAFYEEEVDNISKNLTTILEPVLLVSIGLIVGFLAIAIISPIYQLTGSIGSGGR